MAITINLEPTGIYPGYNNSFVKFSSDLANNNRAEITASPSETFPNAFLIYPDTDGEYVFNLKEVAKTILNANGFADSNFFDDAYFKNISGLYLLQEVTIEVFSDIDSESVVKNYQFFKSVKQVLEPIHPNPYQLLSNSNSGVDYFLTYFEGFPFHFDLQRVADAKTITVKSLNTSVISPDMDTTDESAFRINVDRSEGLNWTDDNFLPLITGLNRLEIYEDAAFKTNLYLTKKKVCSGIYLKWFNSDGGFSHFLFQEYFSDNIKANDIAFVGVNEFLNVGSFNGSVKSIGRSASRSFKVRVKCDSNEVKQIQSLYTSPWIQMYSSRNQNVKGEFIDVKITGIYAVKNKVSNNEFILNVTLPEMITPKL